MFESLNIRFLSKNILVFIMTEDIDILYNFSKPNVNFIKLLFDK